MGPGTERTLAFWIEFAEIWKSLADHSQKPRQRAECLKRAEACLSRAKLIREKIEKAKGHEEKNQGGEQSTETIVS
jgi:hypothetical protein